MVLKKKGHPRYRAHIKGYQSQKAGSPFLYFTLNMIEGTGRQSSYIHFFKKNYSLGFYTVHSYTNWCCRKWNNETHSEISLFVVITFKYKYSLRVTRALTVRIMFDTTSKNLLILAEKSALLWQGADFSCDFLFLSTSTNVLNVKQKKIWFRHVSFLFCAETISIRTREHWSH